MYKYLDIDKSEIVRVKDLWEENRVFHEKESKYFSGDYVGLIFEDRMTNLLSNTEKIKITIVQSENGLDIAYCLSIIHANTGEVATLYVRDEFRKQGIAENLLESHVSWMKENSCRDIMVSVLSLNQAAISLYRKIGFKEDILKMRIPQK